MAIAVIGSTGNLGGRITNALLDKGGDVRILVRADSDKAQLEKFEGRGGKVVQLDMNDAAALSRALEGASVVVSALSGLREVIVDFQSKVLDAALDAKVPRFIPSDYSADFTKLSPGTNRNLDLRREFHQYLDTTPIAATSILNGAFADMLTSGMTFLLDMKAKRVAYYGDPDQLLDFTTMDNVADYTARAALDPNTPRVLRIAGDSISPNSLAARANEITGSQFELVRLGSLDDLWAIIQKERAADPDSPSIFPAWQAMQYMHNMLSGAAKLDSLDNDRYSDIQWTTTTDLIANATKK